MNLNNYLILIIWLLISCDLVYSSIGDRLKLFQYFLVNCNKTNCSSENLNQFNAKQPIYLKIFGWDCPSECKLEAQWKTIAAFKAKGINTIPQFYGKWTFYRLFGIQEPASFFFSIGNFLTNLYGWNQYKAFGQISNDPFYNLWKIQAIIASNAWFWSTIYHARDTPITEKLDYFSAYLIVIYSLYTIAIKLSSEFYLDNNKTIKISITIPFVAFYLYHINYLLNTRFDYGYNMKVNVITGIFSTFGWLIWCLIWFRKRFKHSCHCLLSIAFVNICLGLELFDFAPICHIFDAHSLWHLGTSFFPLFWYSFLKNESMYYLVENDKMTKKLL